MVILHNIDIKERQLHVKKKHLSILNNKNRNNLLENLMYVKIIRVIFYVNFYVSLCKCHSYQ